jgi:hypothetical protein
MDGSGAAHHHDYDTSLQITNVECFVSNVNSALRHRHEQERLRDTIGRIEAYDAVVRSLKVYLYQQEVKVIRCPLSIFCINKS